MANLAKAPVNIMSRKRLFNSAKIPRPFCCIEKSYVSIALLVSLDYLVGVPKFPTSLVNLIYKVRGRHENCPPQTIYLYCVFIISFLFIFVKNFFVSNQLFISTVSDFP